MPSGSTGWLWHTLAIQTGRFGHLYSPGDQRGPWPWFPYAIDNGCFAMWNAAENTFDEERWLTNGVAAWRQLLFWVQSAPQRAIWGVVPDRPGDWDQTVAKWSLYAPELAAAQIPLAVAVQDGATPASVRKLSPAPAVIAVGGSTDWKWETVEQWLREFPHVHVLRVNAPTKLAWLESLGCRSCDGTGWNRGDRKMTRGLEEWAKSKPQPYAGPLWPHASRARCPRQMAFA